MRTPFLFTILALAAGCTPDDTKSSSTDGSGTTATTEDTEVGTTDTDDSGGGDDGGVDCAIGLEEGDCAPDFTLPDSEGVDRSLGDYTGQRVLILGTAEW